MNICLRIVIDLQVSLNFDPAKEILKIRCNIYILMKTVTILRKVHATMKTFASPFFNHLSLNLNRKKCVVMKQSFAVNAFLEAVVCRYSSKKEFLTEQVFFYRAPLVATSATIHINTSAVDLFYIGIENLDWCKCEHYKNEAREIDCVCCREVDVMLIASARILNREVRNFQTVSHRY